MPDVQSLVLKISADAKGYKAAINEAIASTGKLSKETRTLTKGLKDMGFAMSAAAAAIGAGIAAAVTQFATFERRMVNVGSVLGRHYDQMDSLVGKARELGKTTEFTASQAGDAMYYLASAGYETEQIMSSVDSVLQLASATQYDLAETSRIVVGNLNAFNLEAEQADRVVDVFAAAISSSQATMDKLGISMAYVAPISSQLGISIEKTTAMVSHLYNAGIEASRAGTMLRMAMLKLINPTRGAKEAMSELGFKSSELNPELHDVFDIIQKLSDANMSAGQSARIFGARAQGAMSILARAGKDSLEKFTEKITGTNKAQEMMEIQLNSLIGKWNIMKSALTELAISFGEKLAPAASRVVQILTDMFRWISELPAPVQKSISIFAVVTSVLLGVAGAISGIIALAPILIAKLTAINVLMGGIPIIIGAVITALLMLNGAWDKNRVGAQKAGESLDEYVKRLKKEDGNISDLVKRFDELNGKKKRTVQEETEHFEIMQKLGEIYPEVVKEINAEGKALEIDAKALRKVHDVKSELYNLRMEEAKLAAYERRIEVEKLKYIQEQAAAEAKATWERYKGYVEQEKIEAKTRKNGKDYTESFMRDAEKKKKAYMKELEQLAQLESEYKKLSDIIGLDQNSLYGGGQQVSPRTDAKTETTSIDDEEKERLKKLLEEKEEMRKEFFDRWNEMIVERTEIERGEFDKRRLLNANFYNEQFRFFEEALAKGAITKEQYDAIMIELERTKSAKIKEINEDEAAYKESLKKKVLKQEKKDNKELEDLYKRTYNSIYNLIGAPMQQAFDSIIDGTKTVDEAMSDMLKNMRANIMKFMVSQVIKGFISMLANYLVPGSGAAVGIGSRLFSGLQGNAGGSGHSMPVAANGLVTKNVRGPIPAVIHGNEAVVPLDQLKPLLAEAMQSVGGGEVHYHMPIEPVSIDEERFYQNLFEKRIVPAQDRYNRKQGI